MADTSYSFPDDIFATEIPVWMTFLAAPYSTFSQNRTRGYILGNYAADISVPYPTVLSTANTQSYVSGSYPDMEGLFGRQEIDIKRKITIRTVIRSAKGIQWLSFFVPDIYFSELV